LSAQAIDLIIVATSTPDRIFPSTACLVQERLGITNCPAFDVSAACSGFIYALTIAEQFIRTGAAKTALVIGSEVMSRLVDWTDRKTCVLFGDGAGAVLLQTSDKPGIMSSYLNANGQYKDLLTMPSNLPGAIKDADNPYLQMLGSEVFKHAVTTLGNMLDEVIRSNHIDKSAINWLVPHQANLRIILAAAKKLDLPPERVVITVNQHGNTSAASIPIALNQAIRDGRILRGHKVLLEAFGGGMTWGAVLFEF
jgi:3-oxoacyl-[acyl-carrier-protein] synthase-3